MSMDSNEMHRFEDNSLLYSQNPNEDGQFPISSDDARVLMAIEYILTAYDVIPALEPIYNYKRKWKDEEVAEALEKVISTLPPNYRYSQKRKWITIGGSLDIDVSGLAMISRSITYNYETSSNEYLIVINENTSVKKEIPYVDKRVVFFTEESRDEEYFRLKEQLIKYTNITFL